MIASRFGRDDNGIGGGASGVGASGTGVAEGMGGRLVGIGGGDSVDLFIPNSSADLTEAGGGNLLIGLGFSASTVDVGFSANVLEAFRLGNGGGSTFFPVTAVPFDRITLLIVDLDFSSGSFFARRGGNSVGLKGGGSGRLGVPPLLVPFVLVELSDKVDISEDVVAIDVLDARFFKLGMTGAEGVRGGRAGVFEVFVRGGGLGGNAGDDLLGSSGLAGAG
jgi:hypothetical protein